MNTFLYHTILCTINIFFKHLCNSTFFAWQFNILANLVSFLFSAFFSVHLVVFKLEQRLSLTIRSFCLEFSSPDCSRNLSAASERGLTCVDILATHSSERCYNRSTSIVTLLVASDTPTHIRMPATGLGTGRNLLTFRNLRNSFPSANTHS